MTPGQLVRQLLGPEAFKPVGRLWRSAFVSLERVADSFPSLRPDAYILEVGGGDGQMMNTVLSRYPRARATMIDIGPKLGTDLDDSIRDRVEVLPNTSIRDFLALDRPEPDLVSVCDVVHHVPAEQRAQFFDDLAAVMKPSTKLLIKEVRPGTPRAFLALLSDRYISGEKQVTFLKESQVEAYVRQRLPTWVANRTTLIEHDSPNYSIVFAEPS